MKRIVSKKTAIVTGAAQGLGLETAQQLARQGYSVILADINEAKVVKAASKLLGMGFDATGKQLDITKVTQVWRLRDSAFKKFGSVDVLINNAGVMLDEEQNVLEIELALFKKEMDINAFGALNMCQAFVPRMIEQNFGRVVNVASGRGQISVTDNYSPTGAAAAYRMSKTALNCLTRMLADLCAAHTNNNVLVNSVCPGWCRTALGGPHAPRSVKEGAETIVWLATLPSKGPNGGFFRDKKKIAW
jgi:NAD(P)-dependent dehydrogenase (short-subunit alcohol dehydrogenase family)